jgi:PDZ domain-containing protein
MVVTSVTFTQFDMVPSDDRPDGSPDPGVETADVAADGAVRRSARHRWWAVPLAVVGLVAAGLPAAALFLPAGWAETKPRCEVEDESGECQVSVDDAVEFAIVPGSAEPVAPVLQVSGLETYEDGTTPYFVTVRMPGVGLLDWWALHDSNASRFYTYRDKYGDGTPDQLFQSGQRQMTGAKDRAIYVALEAAGIDVSRQDGEAMVDYVVCMTYSDDGRSCVQMPPAAEVLLADDVITAIDGEPVVVLDDVSRLLADVEPGATVELTVRRDGEEIMFPVETILAPDEDNPRTIIGFMPVDTTTVVLPDGLSVQFATGDIGGPSAGLAFTLALIDRLTPGSLVGDAKVVVTGEIDIDGNVGAIGGLNSKAEAALQIGADYFLVPASQAASGSDSIEAARAVAGSRMEVIPVATLEEALAALVRLGGDPLS